MEECNFPLVTYLKNGYHKITMIFKFMVFTTFSKTMILSIVINAERKNMLGTL